MRAILALIVIAIAGPASAWEVGQGPAAIAHLNCLDRLAAQSLTRGIPPKRFEQGLRYACADERYRALVEIRDDLRHIDPNRAADQIEEAADTAVQMDDQFISKQYRQIVDRLHSDQ